MNASCPLCDGECSGAELAPLLDPRLGWFWEQIGRTADRRGDPALVEGMLSVRAPVSADERAAASGLVGGRVLKRGQSRNISLPQLTAKLRVRGASLTPGTVAAHALGRRLALRAAADAQRRRREQELLATFLDASQAMPNDGPHELERIWTSLRRSGWVARLTSVDGPERLLRWATAVVAALPPADLRTDRRRLAAAATGNPHALDHGSVLAGFVMAMLVGAGRIAPRQRPRAAWASVRVDCDDIVGGLTALGILPVGWSLPPGVAVTLPPRTLGRCEWPRPDSPNTWIFVTENPSVASAAADLAVSAESIRLLCTSGTPSGEEVAAIARLALQGWRIAVRADFDSAGLEHVAAVLDKTPGAVPWRMSADDYTASLEHVIGEEVPLDRLPDTSWDPGLLAEMRERGLAAYEESLLPALLDDLRRGIPGNIRPAAH